jgi:hypothetical protein
MLPVFVASSKPAGLNHWGVLLAAAFAPHGSELTMRKMRVVDSATEGDAERWPRERRLGLIVVCLVGVVVVFPRGLALVVGGRIVPPLSFALPFAPVALLVLLAVAAVVVVAMFVTGTLAVAPTAMCSMVVPATRGWG